MFDKEISIIFGIIMEAEDVGMEPRFGIVLVKNGKIVKKISVGESVLPWLVTVYGDAVAEAADIIIEKKTGLLYSEVERVKILTMEEDNYIWEGDIGRTVLIIPKATISFNETGTYRIRWGNYRWNIDDAEISLRVGN